MASSDKNLRTLEVRVQVLPWLSGLIGARSDEEVTFEFSLHPDSTLQQFMDELAIRRPDVAALIYDQEHRAVRATALLMLNDRAFELTGGYGTLLKNGDVITLLAAYIGG